MKEKRNCEVCGEPLRSSQHKYCDAHYNHKSRSGENRQDIVVKGKHKADTGAMSELLVCTDLLQRGYSVYRSVSAGAAFDLVAYKEDCLLRIEVKTGRLQTNGTIFHTPPCNEEYDILAVCLPDEGKVIYEPDLN